MMIRIIMMMMTDSVGDIQGVSSMRRVIFIRLVILFQLLLGGW